MPLAATTAGFHGNALVLEQTWPAAWLCALDEVWQAVRGIHGADVVPDCVWFAFDEDTGP